MKKLITGLTAIALMLASGAPALANEGKGKAIGLKMKAAVEVKHEKKNNFVRREVNLRGTVVTLPSSTLPTTLTIKLSAVSPKYNSKWASSASTSAEIYPKVDGTITVQLDTKSKLYRHFLGKSNLKEMAAGDVVHVVGRLNEDGTISASWLQDTSVQLTSQVYRGVVQSIDAVLKSFTILRSNSTTLTVNTNADTKFTRPSTTTVFSDIQVGTNVGVRGVLNTRLNTMTATKVQLPAKTQ